MTVFEQKQLMEIAAALSNISAQLIEFCSVSDVTHPTPFGDAVDPVALAERIQNSLPTSGEVTDEQ